MSRDKEYLKYKPFADDLREAESWCELDGVLNRYQTVKNLHKMGYRKIHDDHQRQCTCYALGCQMAEELKREVAREIFEEIEEEIKLALESNYNVLPQLEFSNELYNSVRGKIDALRGIDDFIAELKKKYTEVK